MYAVPKYARLQLAKHLMLGWVGMCLLSGPAVAGEVLSEPEGIDELEVHREMAMPPMPDTKVGDILSSYYRHGLGGSAAWNSFVSIQATGLLKMRAGVFEYKGLARKPNLCRQIIVHSGVQCIRGYDGQQAWKQKGLQQPIRQMSRLDGAVYRLNALLGSQLLFPYAKGKRITYVDTVPVKGRICHQLRIEIEGIPVVLDTFLDVQNFHEFMRVYRTEEGEDDLEIQFDHYRLISGVPVPYKEMHFEGGRWLSTLTLQDVKLNTGVMPWMFVPPGKIE